MARPLRNSVVSSVNVGAGLVSLCELCVGVQILRGVASAPVRASPAHTQLSRSSLRGAAAVFLQIKTATNFRQIRPELKQTHLRFDTDFLRNQVSMVV